MRLSILRKYKASIVFGIVIIAVAAILRFYNLNVTPVFVDEAIYVRWSQVMRAEPTLRFLPLSDGKQPLYMWVVMPALKLIEDPLVAARVVSATIGVGTVIGVFTLSTLLFSSIPISLMASFLYAISPFSVFFDRLALADSMLSFFGVWTFVFCLISLKKRRYDFSMLTGFMLGASLLTKSPGIYFALLIPIVTLVLEYKSDFRKWAKGFFGGMLLFTPTYLISYAMYNILRLGPNFHLIAQRNADYVYPLNHIFTSPFDPLKPFLDRSLEYFLILGPSVVVALIAIGFYLGFKKYFLQTLSVFLFGMIPIFVSSEFSRTMTARYIYFSVPYFFILAGIGALYLWRKNLITTFLVGIFVMHAMFINFKLLTDPQKANLPRSERSGYFEDWTSGYGIKEVSIFLREYQNEYPGRKIVVGTEGFFGTLPDGLQMYLNDTPQITVIGVGVYIDKIPSSLRDSKDSGNATFLVVNDSRLVGSPEQLGLTLINKYKKAVKPDGTTESLLLLEVNENEKKESK